MTAFFSSFESSWRELAYHNRGPMKWAMPLLLPFSWMYGTLAWTRRFAYSSKLRKGFSASLPILSVGNLTVGGVGKTPFTLYLAQRLRSMGYHPAILLRGYGRTSKQPLVITPGGFNKLKVKEYGDESSLLAVQADFPVGISPDRMQGVMRLLEESDCDLILLDDGFQHLRLRRDLDLVMVDGNNLFGNEHVLPYGPLREPRSALLQADALVINGVPETESSHTLKQYSSVIFSGGLAWRAIYSLSDWMSQNGGTVIPIERFQQEPVLLVSGIGSPERFKKQACSYGLAVTGHLVFSDHHWFTEDDVRKLLLRTRRSPLLMTEKDAIRFFALQELPRELATHTFVVHSAWNMTHPSRFDDWLRERVCRFVAGNNHQAIESIRKNQ